MEDIMDYLQENTHLDLNVYDMQQTVSEAKRDALEAQQALANCSRTARMVLRELEAMLEEIDDLHQAEQHVASLDQTENKNPVSIPLRSICIESICCTYCVDLVYS